MKESFEKYYQVIEKLTRAANAMWSKVSFISVADVIGGEVDLQSLDRQCWDLKRVEMDMRREASRKMQTYSEDEYEGELEEIDNELDDLFMGVSNKLDAIDDIISNLKKIEEKAEEENYRDLFGDITSIKVDESFNFIELKRF